MLSAQDHFALRQEYGGPVAIIARLESHRILVGHRITMLPASLWAAGGIILAFTLWRDRFFVHDDAFISLRYAVNLVEHGDLAWNPGERVEGFTNLLHLLVTAGLIAVGLEPVVALRLINLFSIVLLLIAFEGATRGISSSPSGSLARALGGFLILGSTPIALWMLGGLEAVMLAGLLTASYWPLISGLRREESPPGLLLVAGALFALAFAVRPDAAVITAASAIAFAFCPVAVPRKRLVAVVALLAPTVVIGLSLTAWRFVTFGDFVPNTFYVKVGVDGDWRWRNGMAYVLQAVLSIPLIGLVLVSMLRTWPFQKETMLPPLAGLIAYIIYVAWAGGDHMPGARLLVPVLPIAALILAFGLERLKYRETLIWTTVAIAFGAAASLAAGRQTMDPAAFVGRLVGQHIAETWPDDSLVALNTAGSTPYYAINLRFIDMLGLNDRTIARRSVGAPRLQWQIVPGHAKGDGAYILSRRPDFVVLGPAEGGTADHPWFLSDLELANAVEFQNCYKLEQVRVPYDEAMAAQGPKRPRPLLFTYYRRICG